ncbi:MAG: nitroreductase family protein [Bacteroidales bacterium]
MIQIDDFMDLIALRSSVRSYDPHPVEKSKIMLLLEAARLAPSAVNFQPWMFLIITGDEGKSAVRQCYDRDWITQAPVYIVACGDHKISWHRQADGKDHCDIDIAIAIEHICLCAAAQGIGSCCVCNFDPLKLKEYLQLSEDIEPVAIIPIGYQANEEVVRPKKRKTVEEISKWVED